MKHIVVKNFGPIKEGTVDVLPLTVFCGKQGSGKSTIAKLISVFSWMEKALFRGYIKAENINGSDFVERYCGYHGLTHYFKDITYLEYEGDSCKFVYSSGTFNIQKSSSDASYKVPKIIYMPAERNLVTAIEDAKNVKNLPLALRDMQVEYRSALQSDMVSKHLPINGFSIEYSKDNDKTWVRGKDHKIDLIEAASGLQSATPLVLTTRYLANKIGSINQELSAEDLSRRLKEMEEIMSGDLSGDTRMLAIRALDKKYSTEAFLNIVEEPEQNLHPSAQRDILAELLLPYVLKENCSLVITTHSPYIINDISIAAKAWKVHMTCNNDQIYKKLNKLLPQGLRVNKSDIAIYEISENGLVAKLPLYEGVPSDDNVLNKYIEESNGVFSDVSLN